MAGNISHATAFSLKDGDLLTLGQGQVTAGQRGDTDGPHPASLTEPPGANRGCHPDRDRRVLARNAFGDLGPELLDLVPLPARWSSRRAHLASHRPCSPLLPAETHLATPPSLRCCDDRWNPPLTRSSTRQRTLLPPLLSRARSRVSPPLL